MEIIEQIGSYAGLAAIVGLAVLSALYFSQARDLRRLREPGRQEGLAPRSKPTPRSAPPRSAEGDKPAATARPQGAVTRVPPPSPSPPAQAASTGSGQPTQAHSPQAARTARAASAPALQRPAPGPRGPSSRSPAAEPSGSPAGPRPWYRQLAPRYVALVVAGLLVLGAGTAFLLVAVTGDVSQPGSRDDAGTGAGAPQPLDPSTITVAVLNGTTEAGLASRVAETVESAGFRRGTVSNFTDEARAESVVLFQDGAERAARQVGQELDIAQIQPTGPDDEALAGNADVVVVLGADRTQAG